MRALATVRQVMPARLRGRGRRAAGHRRARGGRRAARRSTPSVLIAIGAAVRAHEVLRFDYDARQLDRRTGLAPPRRVEPHHLVTWGGRWYLVGWDLTATDWRTFRVDRMTPKTPTGPRFAPRELPGGDVAAFIDAQFRGGDRGRAAARSVCMAGRRDRAVGAAARRSSRSSARPLPGGAWRLVVGRLAAGSGCSTCRCGWSARPSWPTRCTASRRGVTAAARSRAVAQRPPASAGRGSSTCTTTSATLASAAISSS